MTKNNQTVKVNHKNREQPTIHSEPKKSKKKRSRDIKRTNR